MTRRGLIRFIVVFAVAVVGAAAAACAQAYPTKPLQLVVGYPAAGASGQIARIVGPALSKALNQPVEIVDMVGDDGIRAAAHVAKAPADGYSLLLTTTGMVTFHQFLHKDLPYNPQRDFAAVSLVADMDNVLFVSPSFPARTVPALIDMAKAAPGKLVYARADMASTNSLAMILLYNLAQIDVSMTMQWDTLVTAVDAVATGKADMGMQNLAAVLPSIQDGHIRALATTGRVRSRTLPNVPTVGETIPDYRANAWFGIVAPRATPREIVRLLNGQISLILTQPATRALFERMEADTIGGSPDEFETFIQSERTKWRRVIAAAKIPLQ